MQYYVLVAGIIESHKSILFWMSNPYEAQNSNQPLLANKNTNPYIQADYPQVDQSTFGYMQPSPPPMGLHGAPPPYHQNTNNYYPQFPPAYHQPAGNYPPQGSPPAYSAGNQYPSYPPPTVQGYYPPPVTGTAYHKPASLSAAPQYPPQPVLKHQVSAPTKSHTLPEGILHCSACSRDTHPIDTHSFGCVSCAWCFCLLPTGVLWLIPVCSSSCKDKKRLCGDCGTVLVETPAKCC